MKNLLLLLLTNMLAVVLVAQVPGEINYQGVARNISGNPLPNQQIKLRLSIRDGNATGIVVYQETRQLKTNNFGLFTLAIGSTGAITTSGTISSINWGNGKGKYLQVEIDPSGGNSFVNMGAAQLISVPYALYAATAAPAGQAGGSLQGTYPNPTLAADAVTTVTIKDNAVTESKLKDGSVTEIKMSDGAVTSTKIGDGAVTATKINDGAVTASKISDGAVNNDKIADGTITSIKLAPGVIPTSLTPSGTAGGDLSGSYPNPTLKAGAVTTTKIADGTITTAKLAPGVIPTTLAPSGTAGGDLSGSYPNPTLKADAVTTTKIADGAVTTAKLAPGVIPTTLAPSGTAGGDLSGSYPNPNIKASAITNDKIADAAVSTAKIQDGAITSEKLAPGLIVGGSTPSGSAGGDLSGNYPNPNIASGAVTQSKIANGSVNTPKIADGAVTTAKIADLSVTTAKLAAGTIPTSLPPNGAAGGDLSGTYPNPVVAKLQSIGVSTTAPASGQVLKYNGTQWAPGADNGFTLPYSSSVSSATNLFTVTNQGAGSAIEGVNSSTNANAFAILGRISPTTPGASSTGLRGINNGTGANGTGVWGSHAGSGTGVLGTSASGAGIKGEGTDGYGLFGTSTNGFGVFGTSDNGIPAYFSVSNSGNFNDAVFASNAGFGNGLVSISTYSHGVLGIANDVAGAGIFGINNAGGEAVLGRAFSDFAAGVVGRNDGTYAGLRGVSAATNGTAVLAQANVDGSDNGTALVAELEGGTGNLAVFKASGVNVARIDHTGKAYFNNGTQVGGADVAEFFEVEGNRNQYEPGDVLVISTTTDRTVQKSSAPYSTLVSGVFATKAGLLLTEENAEQNQLDHMVPMGVIGVLPTKVCNEGGVIRRGDLLVTSSIPGVAMKGDPEKIKVGQVLGKALQDFDGAGTGKINVLVSVK